MIGQKGLCDWNCEDVNWISLQALTFILAHFKWSPWQNLNHKTLAMFYWFNVQIVIRRSPEIYFDGVISWIWTLHQLTTSSFSSGKPECSIEYEFWLCCSHFHLTFRETSSKIGRWPKDATIKILIWFPACALIKQSFNKRPAASYYHFYCII